MHAVRIIGGTFKRTPLHVPSLEGLRPTPNRVRETLFNWLGQDLTGWRCIDAFAGTGALGFEAASRGAASVLMFECHPQLVKNLKATKTKLHATSVEVLPMDALQGLSRPFAKDVDLVFLDPPFASNLHEAALRASANVLKPNGWVYLESGQEWTPEALRRWGFERLRHARASRVHYHLLASPPL